MQVNEAAIGHTFLYSQEPEVHQSIEHSFRYGHQPVIIQAPA